MARSGSALTAIPFSWDAPYNGGSLITGYRVESNGGSGDTFVEIATTGPSTQSYYASGLTTSVEYEFRVIAENLVGQSLPSSPTPLVCGVPPGAPSAPTKVVGGNE